MAALTPDALLTRWMNSLNAQDLDDHRQAVGRTDTCFVGRAGI
jgi:hypothetical protein